MLNECVYRVSTDNQQASELAVAFCRQAMTNQN
jgi:hypothetical protein